MKTEIRYCTMCKKKETRDECSYGPKIWDMLSLKESVISEGVKRGKVADAILGIAFSTNALQSPEAFVRSGNIESPSVALMRTWSKKREAAERNLDSGRVSHPARNVKKPKRQKELTTESLRDWWNKGRNQRVSNENTASWEELIKDDMKQLTRTDSAFQSGAKGLKGWRPHKAFSPKMVRTGPTPAVRQAIERPVRVIKNLSKQKLKEEMKIDKNTLMMMIIKKMINDKKRKNYLLNYGYIGEAKTPAWARNEGKDLVKGGLNRKGIASYRRENPGSKLSMAVTTKPSKLKKGSKAWKRRKSFCSRSAGQMRMWPKAAKDPNSRLRQARRKWNC